MRRFTALLLLLCLAGCAAATTTNAVSPATPASSATLSRPGVRTSTATTAARTPVHTATASPSQPAPRATATVTFSDFAARALARTNSYRGQFGCPPLRENAKLDQSALLHSQDMARNGYFDHNSPSGQTPWDRIHAAGYQFSTAAENIAAGYSTPEAVIDAFFNETPPNDGHRRNLLNCSLRDVGFGYWYQSGSPYGSYWTQDFATPL